MISIIYSFILILLFIILIFIFIFYNTTSSTESFQNLTMPEYTPYISNPFGSGEEVNNYGYGKDWYQEPDANGLPYFLLKSTTVDPRLVVLPEQLTQTNRKYLMGIVNFDDEFCSSMDTDTYTQYIDKDSLVDLMNMTRYENLEFSPDEEPTEPMSQQERNMFLHKLNKHTWKNRWEDYNPNVDFSLNNKYIESKISDVNVLNSFVTKTFNDVQNNLLTQNDLLIFGKSKYVPFIYKITNIQTSGDQIVYEIRIVLYRDNIQYVPYFYYKGFVVEKEDGTKIAQIFNFQFIGYFLTNMLLIPNGVEIGNEKIYQYYDLNKNYRLYDDTMQRDLLKTAYAVQEHKDSFKLKNQYVCFSTDYSAYLTPSATSNVLLTDNNKDSCQSIYDSYGQRKASGIWDKPCSKDDQCQFYTANKNYPNKRGKCNQSTGYCELPLGMKNMGYHYFIPSNVSEPYCYNCKSENSWKPITDLDNCCWEQSDKKKYPFLKSPDFAYKGDLNDRINYANSENCYTDSNGDMQC